MFKSWSKKQKIKAVFKLQFQATQVPKSKISALMISLVPDDVGKPTVKLEKAAIPDGTLLSGRILSMKQSKLDHQNLAFGEALIDFADFESQTEPMTVSLPLKLANSGAILHVNIHKMDNDQRYYEENGGASLQHVLDCAKF